MRTRLLLLLALMALMLTFSAAAQIDPPEPPVYGYLRICNTDGQWALRETAEPGATALLMLQNEDTIEPLNETTYNPAGTQWRRVRASTYDGWMRTKKPNGNEIMVCLSTNNTD